MISLQVMRRSERDRKEGKEEKMVVRGGETRGRSEGERLKVFSGNGNSYKSLRIMFRYSTCKLECNILHYL